MERTYEAKSMESVMSVFGSGDTNVRLIEKELDVRISNADNIVKITGPDADKAEAVVERLAQIAESGEEPDEQSVRYAIFMAKEGIEYVPAAKGDYICLTGRGKPIKCKTQGQRNYVQTIKDNVITIAIGPAGTGKTYLAVAMAVDAFRRKEVSKIILTRPAVEAGEKLGFLPGDLQMKVDPYLRPLYDALGDMLGQDNYLKYLERGIIEIAPLAYMRGRTLDDAYIILDEAQNTTPEQMKMFLTRIGFGSHAVITGDITQIDLPRGVKSGLKDAVRILKNIEGLAVVNLTEMDVVRHPLVQKIIAAYERSERREERREARNAQ